MDDHFYQFDGNIPSYGYTSATYWVRMTFHNQSTIDEWMLEIAYPPHDHINLYTQTSGNQFTTSKTGDLLPFSTREIFHRNFVFDLSIPTDDIATYYLKIQSDGSMQLPLTLWSENEFHTKNLLEYIILGIYFGFGIIMIIYNLFLYVSLRLSSYLWYVLFVLTIMFLFFTLNGLSYQYLWPNATWWNHRAILFFMGSSNIFALLFANSFLNTKTYTPKLHKLMNWYSVLQLILIIILFINYKIALDLIMGATFSVIVIVLTAAVRCYQKGYAPAKYFLYGWVIFLFGAMIGSLTDMGMIPISFITKYASQLGSSTEIVLFSFALAEKITQLRLEKEAAELQARKSQELAVEHLQRANQMKDEFLANTSHELRTPLHGIIGIAESLQDNKNIDEQMKRNLSLIISSGRRLTNLINDLLDVSKLKHQGMELMIDSVHLRDLAEVVCSISTSVYRNKPIKIVNLIPAELPPVSADESRLQQIMYNLVGNAMKYTDMGEIILSAKRNERSIVISIQDTGIGISDSDMEKIFDSFARGENVGHHTGGTGLGLSITKQLVELHGGEINIHSKLGKGTTVSFSVPIFEGNESATQHIILDPLETTRLTEINNEMVYDVTEQSLGKILIADDESVNIHVLVSHLSKAGYEVKVAYDGEKAITLLAEEGPFDLIILDVMLPKMSGLDVSEKIRENLSLTELPILMLTARSQLDDIITAFKMGANDYLTKPCSKEELLARVKTLLSLKLAVEEVHTVNNELQQLNQSLEEIVAKRTAELEIKTDQLKRMEIARRKLMSNISHELGTPMTSVRGYLKAMMDDVIDPDNPKYLQVVYQKVLVIDRLIQDLYELSRLEARQVSFKWKQYTIQELIATLFPKYELDVEAHQMTFQIHNHLEEKEMQEIITIDMNRIDQVLHNLIFNAIRYMDESGLITIDIRRVDNLQDNRSHTRLADATYLQVSVRDNGKGIASDIIPHLFERFFQEEKARTKQGINMGLGLSISKEIIESHQGYIWVESKIGEGSAFHFILPLYSEVLSQAK